MRQRMKTKNGEVLMTVSLLLLDQLPIVGEELQVLQVVLNSRHQWLVLGNQM